uniref:Uncharacterized protein n=1 Tax=Lotharella oceanica TaxID=641309 RepID=A0A7S2XAL1_9EUKA|mmetsp:Transcript_18725/g.35345  ORF Transcript_18725/g.35345 Transcript_18725/m.35345 type:complete len:123 (+) Transcript_18725:347-715(+)
MWYLGKVTGKRRKKSKKRYFTVLTCEWLNGDPGHTVKEWDNPTWKLKCPRLIPVDVKPKIEPGMEFGADFPSSKDPFLGKKMIEPNVFQGKVVRRQTMYVVKSSDGEERRYSESDLRDVLRG